MTDFPIEDPTLVQPSCAECGLPIRSGSFRLETPHHRFETPTDSGLVVGGVEGIERPRPFINLGFSEGWLHDDPRGSGPMALGRGDHEITPAAFGPRHSHATDYERQLRSWRMNEMEKRAHLGDQFKD
jgi:hypothetical protein